MRLRNLAGDRAAAPLAFDHCKRALKDEVDALALGLPVRAAGWPGGRARAGRDRHRRKRVLQARRRPAARLARTEQATALRIRCPRSTWAGPRSFVDDGEPVCGFDPRAPGFF
jgi:hypothetical protein